MTLKPIFSLAVIASALAAFGADVAVKTNTPARIATNAPTATATNQPPAARQLVKEWKVDDLVAVVNKGLKGGRSFVRGQTLFNEMSCSLCHHFGADGGGVGPDLTGAGGTFSVRDLLENIIEPSKDISSLYGTTVVTKKDGETVTGWVPEQTDTTVSVMEDMFNSGKLTVVQRKDIESMKPSTNSLMPDGLINTLKEEEIMDLVAFLLSGGDSKLKMFAK